MYNAERYIAMRLSMMLQNRFFVSRNIDEMIDRTEAGKGHPLRVPSSGRPSGKPSRRAC